MEKSKTSISDLYEKYIHIIEEQMAQGLSSKDIKKNLEEIIHNDAKQEEQEEGD